MEAELVARMRDARLSIRVLAGDALAAREHNNLAVAFLGLALAALVAGQLVVAPITGAAYALGLLGAWQWYESVRAGMLAEQGIQDAYELECGLRLELLRLRFKQAVG